MSSDAQRVADLLNHQARLLEQAAAQTRQFAKRAAAGEAGSVEEGHGHHYLVDQSMRAVHAVLTNASFGEAFQAAAGADRPA